MSRIALASTMLRTTKRLMALSCGGGRAGAAGAVCARCGSRTPPTPCGSRTPPTRPSSALSCATSSTPARSATSRTPACLRVRLAGSSTGSVGGPGKRCLGSMSGRRQRPGCERARPPTLGTMAPLDSQRTRLTWRARQEGAQGRGASGRLTAPTLVRIGIGWIWQGAAEGGRVRGAERAWKGAVGRRRPRTARGGTRARRGHTLPRLLAGLDRPLLRLRGGAGPRGGGIRARRSPPGTSRGGAAAPAAPVAGAAPPWRARGRLDGMPATALARPDSPLLRHGALSRAAGPRPRGPRRGGGSVVRGRVGRREAESEVRGAAGGPAGGAAGAAGAPAGARAPRLPSRALGAPARHPRVAGAAQHGGSRAELAAAEQRAPCRPPPPSPAALPAPPPPSPAAPPRPPPPPSGE
jgi:hypothetical protein